MALIERTEGLTVPGALANRATTDPERPYIVFEDRVLTYGQAEMRADALAASFAHLGVRPGDRLALVLPAWPEFVMSTFAAAKLGAAIVPINPLITTSDLRYTLRQTQATAAVTVETFEGTDYLSTLDDLLESLPDLNHLYTVGEEDLWYDDRIFQFEDALSAGEGRDYEAPAVDPATQPFAVLYTSGTTGKPKGVEVSHANMLETAARTVAAIRLAQDDVIVGLTGLFHAFGVGPGVLGTLLAGATLVLQDRFDAASTLDLTQKHRATVHYGVPPLFAAEVREQKARPRDLSTLRAGIMAGGSVSPEMLGHVRESVCPGVQVAYSLTETSSVATVTTADDPGEKQRFTVGRPLPGSAVRILAPDGQELPVESVGEIAIKGPGIMLGYLRQPRESAAQFDALGFFKTGDLGMLDEEGYLHLVGRRREVIIRSGLSVFPREVEERLETHPAVDRAAVVAVPDNVLGEAICACLVLEEGALVSPEEVQDWCRVALADYKVPDQIQFFETLPTTGTGKIRRGALAEAVAAQIGVDSEA